MKSFNLSDWALRHRSLVWYFMLAFMAAGLFAYLQLGRQEDPDFTIKTMVIGAQWPGASPEEMTRQVTYRIEKKLEELESLDYTKSVTVAGQTTVFVYLRDTTKAADVAPTTSGSAFSSFLAQLQIPMSFVKRTIAASMSRYCRCTCCRTADVPDRPIVASSICWTSRNDFCSLLLRPSLPVIAATVARLELSQAKSSGARIRAPKVSTSS
jgi:AcrB/AcrD/AcrF family